MRRFSYLAIALAASVFALTACLVAPPAQPAGNTQATNPQTGTTTSGLTASGGVQLRLTVIGDGWVNLTPPGSNCGPTTICMYDFTPGTSLTIYTDAPAIPGSNHSFKEWRDDCAALGSDPYPDLTMNSSMDCTAEFTPEGR